MKSILIACMLMIFSVSAQTSVGVTPTKSPPKTVEQLTKNAQKTPLLYEGNIIYKTTTGKFFVVQQSKAGNFYKKYVMYSPPGATVKTIIETKNIFTDPFHSASYNSYLKETPRYIARE